MSSRSMLRQGPIAAALIAASLAATAQPIEPLRPLNRRPNIVLLMCDDIGWADFEFKQLASPNPPMDCETNPMCCDEYRTRVLVRDDPNDSTDGAPASCIDPNNPTETIVAGEAITVGHICNDIGRLLVDEGMRFNRFYAQAPICTPTRASFQTGRNHTRMDMDDINLTQVLVNRELTIAELAKTQGYITAHFGKWHLGFMSDQLPDGSAPGGVSAWQVSPPWAHGYDIAYTHVKAQQTFNPYERPGGIPRWYWARPDLDPNSATPWDGSLPITDQAVQIADDDGPRVTGYTSNILVSEVEKFLANAQRPDAPVFMTVWFQLGHKAWTSDENDSCLDEAIDDSTLQKVDDYFTAIREFDDQIERLISVLEANGLPREDTIILLTSDNGPVKPVPGSADPLRGHKNDLLEGGVRVPGIFSWPGTVARDAHTFIPASVTDLLPTILDIWDIDLPDSRPLDGASILPHLLGDAPTGGQITGTRSNTIAYIDTGSIPVERSIISSDGQFKLYHDNSFGDPSAKENWQLFDLDNDACESDDVSDDPDHSSNVSMLHGEWMAQNGDWQQQLMSPDLVRPSVQESNVPSQDLDNLNLDNDYTDGIDAPSSTMFALRVDVTSPQDLTPGERPNQEFASTPGLPIVIVERQYATIPPGGLAMDADSTGFPVTYNALSTPAPVSINEAKVVHSFLISHDAADSPGSAAGSSTFAIAFDHKILGLSWTQQALEDSDYLAFAEPSFDPDPSRASLDDTTDSVTIIDEYTLAVTLNDVADEVDHLRVITEAPLQFQPKPCPIDLNNDGALTQDDVTLFLTEFNLSNSALDIAEPFDGVPDFDDVLKYLEAYDAGCD